MSDVELQEILTQAVETVKKKYGRVVLARVAELTPFTIRQLQRLRDNGFIIKSHGNLGRHRRTTKLSGYEKIIDEEYLKQGITNSSIIFNAIRRVGYQGGITILKDYIKKHDALVPAPRVLKAVTPGRGQRYVTGAGEMYQMDWGFVKVEDHTGNTWTCACFAIVCHHCGFRYMEFFPSARQENLFIGMSHAFIVMGVPKTVLTDNMKSVTTGRHRDGTPVWNKEYEAYQNTIGFETRLCKVAHPFTKGAVERLVRYVKDNFIPGRKFMNITELNKEALEWCMEKNNRITRSRDYIPLQEHYSNEAFKKVPDRDVLLPYLAPLRRISYDGFVNYEDRRYGVPLSFSGKTVMVQRNNNVLLLIAPDTHEVIYSHKVDWSRALKICNGQWSTQPEELPTQKVTAVMQEVQPRSNAGRFARFSILEGGTDDDK